MRDIPTGLKSPANRRSFFKKGLTASISAWLLGNGSPLFGQVSTEASKRRLNQGDAAILRFLAAAEILESDLWEQY